MEKKYKVGMFINIALTVICAVIIVLGMVSSNTPDNIVHDVPAGETMEMPEAEGPAFEQPASTFNIYNLVNPILLVLIVCYAAFGYRKPHGNLLKYIMVIFALSLLSKISGAVNFDKTVNVIIYAITMAIIAYVAGRLNRIEQNKFFVVIAMGCLLYISISSFVENVQSGNVIHALSEFVTPLMWSDLCAAYFMRYLQHKEAGLTDKKYSQS